MDKTLKKIQWVLALLVFIIGIYISWGGKEKWIVIGIAVHLLPMLGMLLPWKRLRHALLWFGLFVLIQDSFSLLTAKAELYKTLSPNMHSEFIVSGDRLRGISGHKTVTTDSHGFRVTKDIDYSDDGPLRIFAIGASTTEQIYLDDRETWTHLLQEQLEETGFKNVEVVNTGVSGLRAEHHLATMQATLSLNPDMYIFLVGINDWNKHIREHFGSGHYQKNKFRYILTPVAIRDALFHIKRAIKRSHKDNAVSPALREETGKYYKDKFGSLTKREDVKIWAPDQVDPHYASLMDKIFESCVSSALPCLFLTQPHGYEPDVSEDYKSHFWMTPPGEKFTLDLPSLNQTALIYNSYLLNAACEKALHAYDLDGQIGAGFDYFYDDVHFNENGAYNVAETLAPVVRDILNGSDTCHRKSE